MYRPLLPVPTEHLKLVEMTMPQVSNILLCLDGTQKTELLETRNVGPDTWSQKALLMDPEAAQALRSHQHQHQFQ